MSCEKSDKTQASKEPLALDTAHLMLRKITEMDSHSAFSRRVGIDKKYIGLQTSVLICKHDLRHYSMINIRILSGRLNSTIHYRGDQDPKMINAKSIISQR